MDERAVFLKFELFAKRLGKLCDMYTSIHQISGLEQHTHITGAAGGRAMPPRRLALARAGDTLAGHHTHLAARGTWPGFNRATPRHAPRRPPPPPCFPPGLEAVLKAFYVIVDDIRRKPYDLLDYTKNTFDRDYLEFNVNIHDLDSQMQARRHRQRH